jgi:hypothetical protein
VGDEPVEPGDRAGDRAGSVRVFMSYRRADDRHFIGRLHDQLCGAFGDDMVFRDIDSIPAGTNFRSVILRTLNEVDAIVAVIGPNWARKGEDKDAPDYVYLELAEALKQHKPVIPVLIEGTSMPLPDELPSDLVPLTEIHAVSVHGDPAFRRDSARLIESISDVVTADRERVAQQRRAAEELVRRAEAERSEREQRAEGLRAEERAARARLAELEEASTRRQIELENARLESIAEQLRLAEAADATPPVEPAEQVDAVEARPAPAPVVEAQTVPAPAEPSAVSRTTSHVGIGQFRLQVLIVAATVLGVVGLFLNRGGTTPFNELSAGWQVDATVWFLTLAVAVPLLLGNRPIEQRFVLVGVAASAFFFEFLQASAFVHYGTTGYDEGSWLVVKLLQTVCLVGAIWIVRHRASKSLPSSPPIRVALVAIATACGALVTAATHDEWSSARLLVENEFVPDRTPFVVWFVVLVLGPVGITVGLATRQSYGARVSLATFATLAVVAYVSQALVVDEVFRLDGTRWAWTAVAHVPLAAVASWTAIAGLRQPEPASAAASP